MITNGFEPSEDGTWRKWCLNRALPKGGQWRKGKERPCEHCGQVFVADTFDAITARFCSHACRTEGKKAATPRITRTCATCGKAFDRRPSRDARNQTGRHYCSRQCSNTDMHSARIAAIRARTGPENHRWKGGRHVNQSGYVMVYAPDHPDCQGNQRYYVGEHRLVMEQELGRYLAKRERVHHKNGVKTDNRPENLELWEFGHPTGQRAEERECMIEVPLSFLIALLTLRCE